MSDEQTLKASCEHCTGKIEFPSSMIGDTIKCPHCSQETKLSDASDQAEAATDGPSAREAFQAGIAGIAKAASITAKKAADKVKDLQDSEKLAELKDAAGKTLSEAKDKVQQTATDMAADARANPQATRKKLVVVGVIAVALLGGWLVRYQPWKSQIERYRMWAERGNVEAQFKLGRAYSKGEGVDADEDKALNWITKAADAGHPRSQSALAYYYLFSEPDDDKAYHYASLSAEQGDEEGMSRLGELYFHGIGCRENNASALEWFRKSKEHPNSQFHLGGMYYDGLGVAADADEGVKWLKLAADEGYTEAKAYLGRVYASDKKGHKDEAKAVELLKAAMEEGSSAGKCYLGFCYFDGIGFRRDKKKGLDLIEEAAEEGFAEAEQWLRRARRQTSMFLLGTAMQIGFGMGSGSSASGGSGGGFDPGLQNYYDRQWQKHDRRFQK